MNICSFYSFLFLVFSSTLHSQSTWLQEGDRWGYQLIGNVVNGFDRRTITAIVPIGNEQFRVHLLSEATTNLSDFPQFTRTDTLTLQEDKLYVEYDGSLYAPYDFDRQVGDEYYLPPSQFGCDSLQRFRVDSVGVIEMNGAVLRFQYVSTKVLIEDIPEPQIYTIPLVERLGALVDDFFYYEDTFCEPIISFIGSHLQCYSSADFFYSDPDEDTAYCERLVDTEKVFIENTSLRVFPNPFFDQLTIDIEASKLVSCKLYDVNGALQSASSVPVLDAAHLTSGIYVLQVWTADGKRYIRRVVKH